MTSAIVDTPRAVTLVGGGDASPADLEAALALAPGLVAADGGAALVHETGRVPDAVIGDFDSFPPGLHDLWPADRLHRIAEQDSTDFDKCLRNIKAPLVIGVGFTGARMDHALAALNTLVARPDRRCVILGREDLVFLCPPEIALDLDPGTVVSLFPMGPWQGQSEGLRWPVEGIAMAPDARVGTSNAALGPVRLTSLEPVMLVILPRACLAQVQSALAAASGRWPARAG